VFSAEDAYAKIKAGASLVQLYTGWVYQGPTLIRSINEGLSKLLKQDGLSRIQDAVGVEA
jgi:dihydroorotate dehydrogenase